MAGRSAKVWIVEDMEPMRVLGQRVRARRESLGMSQGDVAAKGDIGEATVRRIEKGELSRLRARTKASLEVALQWRGGLVDDILAGVASESDMSATVVRPGSAQATGSSAPTVLTVPDLLRRLRELNEQRTPEEERVFASLQELMPELLGGKYNPPDD